MLCCANCFLPFNSSLEPLFQIHARPEFQFQGASRPGQAMDQFRQINNRDFSCVSDVEYFAADIVLLDCRHEAAHGIGYVGEASRLESVSVNRNWLSIKHVVNEDRLRPAPPTQRLPGAVRAEDADDRDWDLP